MNGNVGQNLNLDLNDPVQNLEDGQLDLNQPPMDQDLDPVIINPINSDPYGQEEQINYLLQEQGEVYQLNPEEQQGNIINLNLGLQDFEEQYNDQEMVAVIQPQGSPVNYIDEVIPLEQLISSEDSQGGMIILTLILATMT
jgi:hypothetical protein